VWQRKKIGDFWLWSMKYSFEGSGEQTPDEGGAAVGDEGEFGGVVLVLRAKDARSAEEIAVETERCEEIAGVVSEPDRVDYRGCGCWQRGGRIGQRNANTGRGRDGGGDRLHGRRRERRRGNPCGCTAQRVSLHGDLRFVGVRLQIYFSDDVGAKAGTYFDDLSDCCPLYRQFGKNNQRFPRWDKIAPAEDSITARGE
jgi:hypothetical protein